jgi:hypothetical protein
MLMPLAVLRSTGHSRRELSSNESFYDALMSRADTVKYDRSIFIKLMIPLKATVARKSLEKEWNMNPLNKKTLLDASFGHPETASCCSRGTELLFTWTKRGVLEIRIDNK